MARKKIEWREVSVENMRTGDVFVPPEAEDGVLHVCAQTPQPVDKGWYAVRIARSTNVVFVKAGRQLVLLA